MLTTIGRHCWRSQTLGLFRLEAQEFGDRKMAAIARIFSRASGTNVDVETPKTIVIFCGVGLTASLMLAPYGLDLSRAFF